MFRFSRLLRPVLLLVSFLLVGCNGGIPTAPDAADAELLTAPGVYPFSVESGADMTPAGIKLPPILPPLVTINGVRLVTVARGQSLPGGTVRQRMRFLTGGIVTNGDATLIVPPLSVPNGTTISLQSMNNGLVGFKFGPNGLQFGLPAVLKISTAKANLLGIDLSTLRVAGASDNADDWTIIGGVYDPVTGLVVVPITHFSRYAMCVD